MFRVCQEKASEIFQDVSVVHLVDNLREEVVAGGRGKSNWALSTLRIKSTRCLPAPPPGTQEGHENFTV